MYTARECTVCLDVPVEHKMFLDSESRHLSEHSLRAPELGNSSYTSISSVRHEATKQDFTACRLYPLDDKARKPRKQTRPIDPISSILLRPQTCEEFYRMNDIPKAVPLVMLAK
jgi:hypothetical protein